MNLTIRKKLLGGYTVILILLIASTLFIVSKYSEANERMANLVNISSRRINLSNEILIYALQITRHEKNIITELDSMKMEGYKTLIYRNVDSLNVKMNQLEPLLDDEDKQSFMEFIKTWAQFRQVLEQIIFISLDDRPQDAFKISATTGSNLRDLWDQQVRQIIKRNEQNMRNDIARNEKEYRTALNLITILLIASVFLVFFISYVIIQSIAKRISFITSEADKIASRENTDATPRDPDNDELTPVFNALVNINNSFSEVTTNANNVASGNYDTDFVPRSTKDLLGSALKQMTHSLRETTAANEKHNWLTAGQNQLNEQLIGDQDLEALAAHTVTFLASYLDANVGAFYILNEKDNVLVLSAGHAFLSNERAKQKFAVGEGLIGQVASEQKAAYLSDVRNTDMRISSALLNTKPTALLIFPVILDGKTLGVIELGKLTAFSDTEKEFIDSAMESIAVSVNSAMARNRIQELLEETQVQSEELQSQQEELRQINEELEQQAQSLRQQQEELQMTNEELEEQTQALEMKNKEVEGAKYDIEQKTKQLEVSSKYKSEFLANMSHELRTPLNSLLILSKDLSQNKHKNLEPDQIESAEIIYKSGHDLLILINEVLDLSKIEAGKMEIHLEQISLKNFTADLMREFKLHADQKGIGLESVTGENLPEFIRSDSQRLKQILKNLMSNAIKFTEKGKITLTIARHGNNELSITVSDTGIGIPHEKQMAVFEAFQQADGGTSRKYGGTGLGLSISRELAALLGGNIKLKSEVGKGSSFTLVIPFSIDTESQSQHPVPVVNESVPLAKQESTPTKEFLNYPAAEDDRNSISREDKVLLIIEDDLNFAGILIKQARQKKFKCLSAATGEDGLALAERFKPQAIILDLDLPGITGQKVLAELKATPALRHIPVHIISGNERSLVPIKEGAVEYLTKPVSKENLDDTFNRIENFVNRKIKNLLIIEDDENSRKAMRRLIGNGDVKSYEAGNGKEALSMYQEHLFDCIVLDIGLPDMTGFELIYKLEEIKNRQVPPIIIYTGKELTKEENTELQKYAETIIIKGVKSEERLLDETALFLHRTINNLPEDKQQIINNLYDKEAVFQKKKILLVDDDMRNVFALTKVLKERGMEVVKADNGKVALEMLNKNPDCDLVLMDIMMPEMDGYEAMREIRLQSRFRSLPVIALTAKAMKEDKQKCIDAGANDYITKPIDVERLLSLMRVWLSK